MRNFKKKITKNMALNITSLILILFIFIGCNSRNYNKLLHPVEYDNTKTETYNPNESEKEKKDATYRI